MKNLPRHWPVLIFFLFVLSVRADEQADWVQRMRRIIPKGYVCHRVTNPLAVDGKLDEAAWKSADWTTDFVDIEGDTRPKPRFRTRAKLLWDENYLYIGAELEEPHVWATLTNHDSVIFHDPDFEVFIDPAGNTQPYYEFEMNALNTTWDLLLNKPYMDGGHPHDAWEMPGTKTAVTVRGTLNEPGDKDDGWTVEIAFPWSVLSEHASHAGPPTDGEQWRLNFSRVEWQIVTTNGAYQKIPGKAEDNWVWSPQGVVDMHRPEMWGQLKFSSTPPGHDGNVAGIPGKAARDAALEIYYAQRVFHQGNHRWATNLAELPLSHVPGAELTSTPEGYTCSVSFQESGKNHVWRVRQDRMLTLDQAMPLMTDAFVSAAAEKFGDAGRRAAYFIVDNMPATDRESFDQEFQMENLSLAFAARKKFPWATNISERMFFNDVLPYASVDEPRDPWRAEFFSMASDIVKDCRTATEAAQALNRELFKRINVHYNTARKRNNQSPRESIEQGKATCTGLAIILVDACRAVGVPARIVGVPEWASKEGNHTWVEIWDGEWFFTGADEYDKEGLNRGWFVNDAANTARSTNALNQLYASSWRRTGDYFPMAWDLDSRQVPAVNVSARYAALTPDTNTLDDLISVRLLEKNGGQRVTAIVEMCSDSGVLLASNVTRSGTADMNDMPGFKLPEHATKFMLRFTRDHEAREKLIPCVQCMKSHTLELAWDELKPVSPEILAVEQWLGKPVSERGTAPEVSFSKAEAQQMIAMATDDLKKARASSAEAEITAKHISVGEHSMKWLERAFGEAADGEHSLWITMHGGGQGTEAENDANWHGYYGRYEFPPGSINLAPRAPANTWDMWHVKWVDDLFDRMIADYVLQRGVNPSRVYLIGYSAGGDGVYQLAPRLSDRFAAAGMCAGHPNEITPDGLRNIPFFLYMGGADDAYHRNTVVVEFSKDLDALQAKDPGGYAHRLTVYPGLPHNMQGREAEMIPRMVPLRRVTWPDRVVWKQDNDAVHTRLYWLERDPARVQPSEVYAAHVEGQTITIETPATGELTLRLSDELLDLDQPVRVVAGGKTVFDGVVKRSFAAVEQSLHEREDPQAVCTALLKVQW